MRCLVLVVFAACSSPSQQPDAARDASPDAEALDQYGCPPDLFYTMSITDGASTFSPVHLVLVQGEYAKFVTSSTHDMQFTPSPETSTGTFDLPFSTTRCFHFEAGHASYTVKCTVHGEMGDILVAGSGP